MKEFLLIWKATSFRWHLRNPQRLIVAIVSLFIGSILGNVIIDLNARTAGSFSTAMSATMNSYGTEIRFSKPVNPTSLNQLFEEKELDHFIFFPFIDTFFQLEGRRYPLTITFCQLENCTKRIQLPQNWKPFLDPDTMVPLFNKSFPVEFNESPLSTAQLDISAIPTSNATLDGLFLPKAPSEKELESILRFFTGSQIISKEEQKTDSDSITSAFRQNLFALAMVALLVAGYLVYASLDISFENRSQLFSSLISLGTKNKHIGLAILLESVLLGLFSGTTAWVLGSLLARKGWEFFSLILPDVFGIIPSQYDSFLPGLIIIPIATLTSILAAYLAYKRREFQAGRKRESLMRTIPNYTILILATFVIFISSYLLFYYKDPRYGYISVFGLFFFISKFSPISIAFVSRIYPKSISWKLASRALEGYNLRFMAPVSALAVAISLCISMTVLIASFKYTLNEWLTTNVKAESYFSFHESIQESEKNKFIDQANQNFPLQVVRLKIGSTFVNINDSKEKADLMIQSFSELNNTNIPAITEGKLKSMLASETAIMRWNLQLGDKVYFPELNETIEIDGIFKNYTSRRGTFLINLDDFEKNTFIENLNIVGIAIYLRNLDEKNKLDGFLLDNMNLGINQPSAELREAAISLFEKTFSITYILQIITFLLASSAIAFSLISLITARKRQFAILASYTAKPKTPLIMILVLEAFGILTASLLIAIPGSAYLTWILIEGINRFSFGWTLSWSIPYFSIMLILLGSFASGIITTIYLGSRLPIRNIWQYLKSRE
ncbi:MAG: ABC transporter permease [Leptospira sp.]|nr:ABC transporter permease [Leptospira sp.]